VVDPNQRSAVKAALAADCWWEKVVGISALEDQRHQNFGRERYQRHRVSLAILMFSFQKRSTSSGSDRSFFLGMTLLPS
jgi:hypothetical protein